MPTTPSRCEHPGPPIPDLLKCRCEEIPNELHWSALVLLPDVRRADSQLGTSEAYEEAVALARGRPVPLSWTWFTKRQRARLMGTGKSAKEIERLAVLESSHELPAE